MSEKTTAKDFGFEYELACQGVEAFPDAQYVLAVSMDNNDMAYSFDEAVLNGESPSGSEDISELVRTLFAALPIDRPPHDRSVITWIGNKVTMFERLADGSIADTYPLSILQPPDAEARKRGIEKVKEHIGDLLKKGFQLRCAGCGSRQYHQRTIGLFAVMDMKRNPQGYALCLSCSPKALALEKKIQMRLRESPDRYEVPLPQDGNEPAAA